MLNLSKKIPCRYNSRIYAYESYGSWEGTRSIDVKHNTPEEGCTTTTYTWDLTCVNTWDIVCSVGEIDKGTRTIVDC